MRATQAALGFQTPFRKRDEEVRGAGATKVRWREVRGGRRKRAHRERENGAAPIEQAALAEGQLMIPPPPPKGSEPQERSQAGEKLCTPWEGREQGPSKGHRERGYT